MNSFGITDRGKVRRDNQDSFLIERLDENDCLIAVVCDGMGGEKAGNIASDLAAKTFMSKLKERLAASSGRADYDAMLTASCSDANYLVYSYSCFDQDYTGMGTTLVAAMYVDDKLYVLNVGDSRAYKLTKNRIIQISRDHSLVQEMVDRGELTEKAARTHPRRNVITRALGVNENVPSDVFRPRLQKGDRLLLCSDGLTNMIADAEILEYSRKYSGPLELGRALMDEALSRGARDNVTMVIVSK